jgi:hypothetical protein
MACEIDGNEIWEGKRLPPYDSSEWICDKYVGYIITHKDGDAFYTVLSAWLPMVDGHLAALGGAEKFAKAAELIRVDHTRRQAARAV